MYVEIVEKLKYYSNDKTKVQVTLKKGTPVSRLK